MKQVSGLIIIDTRIRLFNKQQRNFKQKMVSSFLRMPKLLYCTLMIIASSGLAFSQGLDETKFVHYNSASGLSNNLITGLVQDAAGYIWISTANGLNRFDGKEMKQIHQKSSEESLIAENLVGMKCSGDRLLVYSAQGGQWINTKKNRFRPLLPSDKKQAIYKNSVFDAVGLHRGIAFVTTHTGAYAFDSLGKLIFCYDHFKEDADKTISSGRRYGFAVMALNATQALHLDMKYKLSIYDSQKNSFLTLDAYKKSLPGLYSLRDKLLGVRCSYKKNSFIFLDLTTFEFIIYDPVKDSVQTQPVPARVKQHINWETKWLTLNDTTALLYGGGFTGIYTVHINPVTNQFTYDTAVLFRKEICKNLLLDREDRLWVGTENGLFKQNIKPKALHAVDLTDLNLEKLNYSVWFSSFLRDDDVVYAGSHSYLPSLVLDGKTYEVKKRISFEKLSPLCNGTWNIIKYSTDTLWFATQDGVVWYNTKNGHFNRLQAGAFDSLLRGRAITLLHKDSKGLVWLQPGWGNGVLLYNPATKKIRHFSIADKSNYLPLRVVNFITEDQDGNIWMGENGLIRWNRKKEIFDTLITSYYGFNKDNSKIRALGNDEKGNLVLCNENNGVLYYNIKTNQWKQITLADGLQENTALGALALANQYLWVPTHNFITAIRLPGSKTISYSYSDGLPASIFINAYHDKIAKRMLFGYNKAIVWTSDSINDRRIAKTPFYIDALQLAKDSALFFPSSQVELNHKQNDITIYYAALNFEDPENNRYAYRMNDEDWISLGSENVLRFSRLSAGKYDLEIKYYSTSNPDSEVSRNFILIVHPPFWETMWFYIAVVLLIAAIIILLYKKRIRQIKQKAGIEKQLAEFEIKALHAQMNPHFVFNCLNSIREMILSEENRQASHYLSKFAQLMRLTLEHSSKPFISLNESVDYLHRYLEMEQIRSAHFSYEIEVNENIETKDVFLPPMLIQPFIENAIWHGSPRKSPLHIYIRFLLQEGNLLCIIEDNGIGLEASLENKKGLAAGHHSVGIDNVKQRIQVLNEKYNLKSSVSIEDKKHLPGYSDTGTVVMLNLLIKPRD